MKNACWPGKYFSRTLKKAAKNIFVKSLLNHSIKHDTAVIIVLFTESLEFKRNQNKFL